MGGTGWDYVNSMVKTPSGKYFLGGSLKLALLAGEPWTEAERAEIESRLYLTALENYALSEALGPGVAGECAGRSLPGMHLNEDHFFPEVIDPKAAPFCPPASWENWCSPPSPGRPRLWCASAPAIWCAWITSPAPAAAPWPA